MLTNTVDIQAALQTQITTHNVVLYMKGTPDFPQCGFSSRVVQILRKHRVDFEAVNVLTDDAVRQGIKDFSNWPTIPQLYINGTFIGGCDIVCDLDETGRLAALLSG